MTESSGKPSHNKQNPSIVTVSWQLLRDGLGYCLSIEILKGDRPRLGDRANRHTPLDGRHPKFLPHRGRDAGAFGFRLVHPPQSRWAPQYDRQ